MSVPSKKNSSADIFTLARNFLDEGISASEAVEDSPKFCHHCSSAPHGPHIKTGDSVRVLTSSEISPGYKLRGGGCPHCGASGLSRHLVCPKCGCGIPNVTPRGVEVEGVVDSITHYTGDDPKYGRPFRANYHDATHVHYADLKSGDFSIGMHQIGEHSGEWTFNGREITHHKGRPIQEGISASGLSGQTDGGAPGPGGGGPMGGDEDQTKPPVEEDDVLAFSGSGPTTFIDPSAALPWNGGGRGGRKRRKVSEGDLLAMLPKSNNPHVNGIIRVAKRHGYKPIHPDDHMKQFGGEKWEDGHTEPRPHILLQANRPGGLYGPNSKEEFGIAPIHSIGVYITHHHENMFDKDMGGTQVSWAHWNPESLVRTSSNHTDKPRINWNADPVAELANHLTSYHTIKESIQEHEGYLLGHPTDSTQTGLIQIQVLDSTNLRIHAPSILYEQVEAYKFFSEFMRMLPISPMLNIRVMESVASWWRNFAEEGDLLEIDCTSGFAKVTNTITGNFYGLGCLGSIPTYTGLVS